MTRNAPSGWAVFRALRQAPAPIPVKRHGNWRHGAYTEARIQGMREFRALIRAFREATRPQRAGATGVEV